MSKIIIDDIEIFSGSSYNEDSDEENPDEKILMKKIKYINLFLVIIKKI